MAGQVSPITPKLHNVGSPQDTSYSIVMHLFTCNVKRGPCFAPLRAALIKNGTFKNNWVNEGMPLHCGGLCGRVRLPEAVYFADTAHSWPLSATEFPSHLPVCLFKFSVRPNTVNMASACVSLCYSSLCEVTTNPSQNHHVLKLARSCCFLISACVVFSRGVLLVSISLL